MGPACLGSPPSTWELPRAGLAWPLRLGVSLCMASLCASCWAGVPTDAKCSWIPDNAGLPEKNAPVFVLGRVMAPKDVHAQDL